MTVFVYSNPNNNPGIETNTNHKKENFIYENINYHYSTDC